jgi:tetratricopeptide (TPR) repeat protein
MLRTRRNRILCLTLALVALFAIGCAYYNTLYNAKKRYQDAEKIPLDPEGNVTRQATGVYDEVIAKCRKMIDTWPKSRHVDDAMLLIGQSYYGSERYDRCVEVLDSLTIMLPDTELMPRVLSLKGSAYALWGEHEQAVEVLVDRVEQYDATPGSLYYLSTSLMSLGRSDEAVAYLGALEKEYPDKNETFDARVTIAEILSERGEYEKSQAVYERLTSERLPETFRYSVWMGQARVYVELGRHEDALATIALVRELALRPNQEPDVLLLAAEALAGSDSLDAAIATYDDITERFSRGEYAAEAHYRLGNIYEEMDSLEVAMRHFEDVSKAYPNYEYARESLKRSNDLSTLLRLERTADDNSPEALALRTFSMAELQLFEFSNTGRALEAYQLILSDYPDTEFGPKAAFAVGYIYAVVLADTARALESVRHLLERYPGTQQSAYADQLVASIGAELPEVPPDLAPWVPPNQRGTNATAAGDTTAAGGVPAIEDTTATAVKDTTAAERAIAAKDTTTARGSPAADDTTNVEGAAAKPDTTAGGE